ncbi:putative threonine dehydratase [Rosellinia necatrix]|uniref:Putative threonine dehydratase n=1 Tax=Rosellinia necatrix TaxID=77044 RepID=A0A1S8A6M5_ROSNE|nr:putative threonine dehydratase [Rosellinia necatrix]
MADPSTSPPLTRASVVEARELIKGFVHHTPTLTNATLNRLASTPAAAAAAVAADRGTRGGEGGAGGDRNEDGGRGRGKPANPRIRLYFKCENLQRVGAFKIRGAFHAIERLKREPGWEEGGGRERGVVTHSSGECWAFSCFSSVFVVFSLAVFSCVLLFPLISSFVVGPLGRWWRQVG